MPSVSFLHAKFAAVVTQLLGDGINTRIFCVRMQSFRQLIQKEDGGFMYVNILVDTGEKEILLWCLKKKVQERRGVSGRSYMMLIEEKGGNDVL